MDQHIRQRPLVASISRSHCVPRDVQVQLSLCSEFHHSPGWNARWDQGEYGFPTGRSTSLRRLHVICPSSFSRVVQNEIPGKSAYCHLNYVRRESFPFKSR